MAVRFFTLLRLWPLLLIYSLKRCKRDENIILWQMDMAAIGTQNILEVLTYRPYYRELLYVRLGLPIRLSRLLWGSYPVSLSCKNIGGGVHMEHPFGSVISAKSVGTNLELMQGVIIGQSKGGLPTIGNNVFCGVGSCILGEVMIGDNVKIGANAVVVKDVPSDCTVIGSPAFIIKQNGVRVNIKL